MTRRIAPALIRLNHRFKRHTTRYMVVLAVIVGLAAGYGAVGFRLLISWFEHLAWGDGGFTLEHARGLITSGSWYWILLVPAVGGAVVTLLVSKLAPEAHGHGVPEVMEAVAVHGGRMPPRVVGVKALASALTISSGGSAGPEGPIVQIGAAIASAIGQLLHLSPRRLRTLSACGAGAGIAAVFNAPVAGALFAVEVILGDFGVPQFSPIVISSVVATVVSRRYLGDTSELGSVHYAMNSPLELIGYVVLGVLAAFVSVAFMRMLSWSERCIGGIRLPVWIKGALGGLAVGSIGLVGPGLMGVGYGTMNQALMLGQGDALKLGVGLLALLLVGKAITVCITLGSGGSGGVFAPSMFLGGMVGGIVGLGMEALMPGAAPAGAYALVGMGAVVAATTHSPIMSIVMMFEVSNDYRIILPLMVSCIMATLLAQRLFPDSIYTMSLARRGVNVRAGRDVKILRGIRVSEVMRTTVPKAAAADRLNVLLDRLVTGTDRALYVVDEEDHMVGVVTIEDVRAVLMDAESVADVIVAGDVARGNEPTADAGDTLDQVLRRLAAGYRDQLPVLSQGALVGLVRTEDVLSRYQRELFKHEMAFTVASGLDENAPVMHRAGAYAVAELVAPRGFLGKTLAELQVRQRHGVTVLLIKPEPLDDGLEPPPVLPEAEHRFEGGDRLVLFGPEDAIEALRTG